jgi:thiol-disulfide isomerase/thioredoxin
MRLLIILTTILFCFNVAAFSQKVSIVAKVGDVLPDLQLNNILNYKTTRAKISDFKAGLVIFDFWATWCAPCISSFPKLDSLQKQFKGEVQIVPVTKEDKNLVKQVLDRMENITDLLPMTVTGDIELNRIFPHIYLPHYVWVNEERKVVAITDGNAVNEKNIKAFLNNTHINLPVKKDQQVRVVESNGYNLFAPSVLTKNENGTQVSRLPTDNIGFSSLLTGYVEGLHPGFTTIDSTHFYTANRTIQGLYQTALYGASIKVLNTTNLIVDINDSSLLKKITTHRRNSSEEFFDWLKNNGYCYEVKVPSGLARKKYDIMLRDLNNYFGAVYGLEGQIEDRLTTYLALEKFKESELIKPKNDKGLTQYDNFHLKIQNGSVSTLLAQLAIPLQMHPMILDETGIHERIDIELNCVISDLNSVKQELERYGLRLVERKKVLKMAVIKQVKK